MAPGHDYRLRWIIGLAGDLDAYQMFPSACINLGDREIPSPARRHCLAHEAGTV